MTAFFVGDFLNSVVLAKMKIWTQGKHLWTRTIGSTIIGEGADSLIFYPLAFYGMPDWPVATLGAVMLSQFILKVSWEVLADARHLCGGRLAQAPRRRRCLRRRHRLHAVHVDTRRLGGDRLEQPFEQPPSVGAAVRRLDRPLGVRHQAEHVAGIVEDAGDAARRAVDLVEVAEGDAALAFEPVERRFVGLVIAVVVRDREADLLASVILRR